MNPYAVPFTGDGARLQYKKPEHYNKDMTQYRTAEQFNDIIDSAVNGNWSQARDQVKKYGFYAEDLIKAYEELTAEYGEPPTYFKAADLAHLIPDSRTDRT